MGLFNAGGTNTSGVGLGGGGLLSTNTGKIEVACVDVEYLGLSPLCFCV